MSVPLLPLPIKVVQRGRMVMSEKNPPEKVGPVATTTLPEAKKQKSPAASVVKSGATNISGGVKGTSSKSTMDSSLYSTSTFKSSITALNRRKASSRAPGMIPAVNEVKQRVMSAKLLRIKQLQNQLNAARGHIVDLTNENRLLKTIHKRQDSALAKYEGTNAELPQLLASHQEELRVWQTKCKNLQQANKELAAKIKQKDAILLSVTDQNKHLTQLNKDRSLEEREKLTERLKDLEERLLDKDNDAKLLARRLQLEMKSFKVQLQQENQKYRECYSKLERAHAEIQRLNQLLEHNNFRDSPTFARAKTSRQRNKSASNEIGDFLAQEKPPEPVKSSSKKGDRDKSISPVRQKASPTELAPPLSPKLIARRLPNGNARLDHGEMPNKPAKFGKANENGAQTGAGDEKRSQTPIIVTDHGAIEEISVPNLPAIPNTILDHKKHIEEIEAKLKSNFSSSSSTLRSMEKISQRTFDRLDRLSSPEEVSLTAIEPEKNDLEVVKKQLNESLMKKETLLDSLCDELTKSSPVKKERSKKKKDLDPAKKSKLLAALKAIDGNDSLDK